MPLTRASMAALAAATLVPAVAAAEIEVDWHASLSNRLEYKRNFIDTTDMTQLKLDQAGKGYYFYGTAGVDLDADAWSFTMTLDTGILKVPALYRQSPAVNEVTANDKPVADEARKTLLVRELFIDADLALDGALSVTAGKYNASVGKDFVYNDYTLGMNLELDLAGAKRAPFRASLQAIVSDGTFSADGKRSPLVSAEAAYVLGKGEEAGLIAAWFHDGDDNVGEIVKPFVSEFLQNQVVAAAKHAKQSGQINKQLVAQLAAIERACGGHLANCMTVGDRAELFWAGLYFNKIWSRLTLGGVALVNFGSATLDPYLTFAGNEVHVFEKTVTKKGVTQARLSSASEKTVLGGMADLDASYELLEGWSVSSFFLWLSGDSDFEKVNNTRLSSFIAVMPYITKTDIFFNGGMNESASARALSTSGINAHGVLAPGLGTTWAPVKDVLELKLGAALLLAESVNPQFAKSRVYGWELNFNTDWTATPWLDLMLEADFFKTGAFFDHPADWDPYGTAKRVAEPNPYRVMLGADVHYH